MVRAFKKTVGEKKNRTTRKNDKQTKCLSPVNADQKTFGRQLSVAHIKISRGATIKQYLQVVDLSTPEDACSKISKDEHVYSDEMCSINLSCPSEYYKSSNQCEIITDQPCQITETPHSSPATPHRIKLDTNSVIVTNSQPTETTNTKQKPPKRQKKNISDVLGPSSVPENHVITEYFPVRRSNRRTKRVVLEEKKRSLEDAIKCEEESGLKICYFEEKGRGIISTQEFQRGDYVVEYRGDLIDVTEAKRREQLYARDKNTGCYMYYFKYKNQQYCVDATAESKYLGRLVNHSRNGNLVTRIEAVSGVPHLVLLAREDIPVGHELTYDYGDRSKESLKHHPWLAL